MSSPLREELELFLWGLWACHALGHLHLPIVCMGVECEFLSLDIIPSRGIAGAFLSIRGFRRERGKVHAGGSAGSYRILIGHPRSESDNFEF